MRLRIMLWLDSLAHRYCDWFENWLRVSEPAEAVVHAFERNPKGVTARPVAWSCEHATMTSGGMLTNPRSSCGCDMKPVY